MIDPGILIVDDDADILRLLEHLFASAGQKVHCAGNGEDALAELRRRPFRFLLTDFHLPGLNGLELAVRARELAPDLEIVLGTAEQSEGIRHQAGNAGIGEILYKPFKVEDVLRLAGRWGKNDRISGPGRWICPACRTVFCGWSPANTCSECGFHED